MNLTEIAVARLIPAPVAEVFDVWLDPHSPGGPWFGGAGTRVILNPFVDGLFYSAVSHEGKTWAHYGRFIAIERPRRVENTWVSEATRGMETIVTVTFEPQGEQTNVTLTHSGVPDDEMGRKHKDGWTFVLSSLAQRFGK
jgi:uncharacterized protein YndB with AHSA1/START domain